MDTTIVNGEASTGTGINVTATGKYYWEVVYSGDSQNNSFTLPCGDEVTEIRAKDLGRNNITP